MLCRSTCNSETLYIDLREYKKGMMTAMKTLKNLGLLSIGALLSLSLLGCSIKDGKVKDNHSDSDKATPTSMATERATENTTPTSPSSTDNMMDDVKDGMERAGENIKDGIGDTKDKILPH